jgi:DHA2 family multidrug resistance protein
MSDWTADRSVAGKRNPWSIVAVISIATFMVVLDTSIANVALAHIAGALAVSYDESTWVITSFLVANAVIIPLSSWLANVIGRKRYYMFSVALFTGSSLLCGMAPNLTCLVIARVLQGIGGGGLAPVEQSMLVDSFPPEKRGIAFAAYGVVVITGPILGPTLGGWITDNFSWHWVFLINVPIGLLSLSLVSLFVEEPESLQRQTKDRHKNGIAMDYVGFAFVALWLGCMEIALDRGQRDDWFASSTITICAVIAVLSFAAMIPWELMRRDPIVDVALFKRRNFAISSALMFVMGVIIFGSTQFIPQLLQEVMFYTATSAGLAMTSGGIATIVMMPLVGVLADRVDSRYLIAFGLVLQILAFWDMSHLSTQLAFYDAGLARMIQAAGLPFLFVPITKIAYVGLPPEANSQASALMNVARNLGGTIGISTVQSMLAQNEQVHQARLVSELNPLNATYAAALKQMTSAYHGIGAGAGRAALHTLYQSVLRQSAMLSYLQIFAVMMIMVICALPLLLIMQKANPDKAHEDPG